MSPDRGVRHPAHSQTSPHAQDHQLGKIRRDAGTKCGLRNFDKRQIADRRDGGRIGDFRAERRPQLHPAIERPAQQHKGAFGHPLVLEREVLPNEGNLFSEPSLVATRGADDVHVAEYMALH